MITTVISLIFIELSNAITNMLTYNIYYLLFIIYGYFLFQIVERKKSA